MRLIVHLKPLFLCLAVGSACGVPQEREYDLRAHDLSDAEKEALGQLIASVVEMAYRDLGITYGGGFPNMTGESSSGTVFMTLLPADATGSNLGPFVEHVSTLLGFWGYESEAEGAESRLYRLAEWDIRTDSAEVPLLFVTPSAMVVSGVPTRDAVLNSIEPLRVMRVIGTDLLSEAAGDGMPEAQFALGLCLLDSDCQGRVDGVEAFVWLERATQGTTKRTETYSGVRDLAASRLSAEELEEARRRVN